MRSRGFPSALEGNFSRRRERPRDTTQRATQSACEKQAGVWAEARTSHLHIAAQLHAAAPCAHDWTFHPPPTRPAPHNTVRTT